MLGIVARLNTVLYLGTMIKHTWTSHGTKYHTHSHGFRLATSKTAIKFRRSVAVPFYDTANIPCGTCFIEVDTTPVKRSANGLMAYIPQTRN